MITSDLPEQGKPLSGLRVLELTTYVAAPTCGKLLCDQGAEVIKVEAPRGDAWRYGVWDARSDMNPRFHVCNSGKRSVVLDLKTDAGMVAMKKLLARADVFITNTRMKSLEKLGLDPDTVRAEHPKLIYAHISGYGPEGEEADRPAYDTVAYWARSGFMTDLSIDTGNSYPVDGPVGVGDSVTGMCLYAGILSALIQRDKTGQGDFVTTSLYNAGIWTVSGSVILSQTGGRFPKTRRECVPDAAAFRCADGEWIQVCVMEPLRYDDAYFDALGLGDLARASLEAPAEEWGERRWQLTQAAEKAFATRPVDEWVELLSARDIPCCRMAHFRDIPQNRQAWANDYVEDVTERDGSHVVIPTSPIRLGSQGVNRLRPAPHLGEHTQEVLSELEEPET